MLTNCAKWTGAICVLLISPAVLIYAPPIAAGIAGDALEVAGTPAALAVTVGLSLAALLWARRRER